MKPSATIDETSSLPGGDVVEMKANVAGLREIRSAVVRLAYRIAESPAARGILLLVDPLVTTASLSEEWKRAASILRPEALSRLAIITAANGRLTGNPSLPGPETQRRLLHMVQTRLHVAAKPRGDAHFVVLKMLILAYLAAKNPVTTEWLISSSGYSYPTVAKILHELGDLIERGPGRRVRLRYFPKEIFAQMQLNSSRARSTVCFADRSGQPRPPEAHLDRLVKLAPPGIGIGGVIASRHYCPDLDITGSPRLDLTVHAPTAGDNLAFMNDLDPALKPVSEKSEPASVAVHVSQHATPFFLPREGGLQWADQVECLLDLFEARLDAQGNQFLEYLIAGLEGSV